MRARPVTRNLSQITKHAGRPIRFIWFRFCGSILRECDGSSGTDGRFPDRADESIQIVHDPLGRPQLLLGESQGPAISFSEGGGMLWAALCEDASDIGIDAADAADFSNGYPFHRVFQAQELGPALRLTGGDWKKASALLWSIKEAAVKATGMRIPSCRSAAHLRRSLGCRNATAGLSLPCDFPERPWIRFPDPGRPMGPFAFPGIDVAFHRPVGWATDQTERP